MRRTRRSGWRFCPQKTQLREGGIRRSGFVVRAVRVPLLHSIRFIFKRQLWNPLKNIVILKHPTWGVGLAQGVERVVL
jgi:hypothetical protein